MRPIIIEAALNGGRSRHEHLRVPITPTEVTAEARRCRDAGACVVHIHAQDADGRWSAAPAWYAEAIRLIRAAVPDVLVSITSIRPAGIPATVVLDLLANLAGDPLTRPDLISVNLGHIVAWPPTSGGRTTEHYPNEYADIVALLAACHAHAIVPELGLMDFGFVSNAVALRDDGVLSRRAWFLVELDSPGWGAGRQVAPATPEVYDAMVAALSEQFPAARWAAHGAGTATWDVVRRAIEQGAHVRIGFEDTVTMPDGSRSPSNAAQVEWVATRSRLLGREPATPEEAWDIIGRG